MDEIMSPVDWPTEIVDLNNFAEEFQSESDRGTAIIGAAYIDAKLAETLLSFFCDGVVARKLLFDPNAPVGTFSSRIDICYSLALIDDNERSVCHLIRKVRNEFAHGLHGVTFKTPKVAKICQKLRPFFPNREKLISDRDLFIWAIIQLSTSILYRPDDVAHGKRAKRKWTERIISPERT